ncbi:hypothetical protein Egran_03594 [Elaphomyces granulatus]|uniref:Uncharacterized protein n=1 Tax=Elaphomyces granulatus TaxID=519963 RepID=A0A232LWZ7_9EURO|nr:hypothetical protein Egran_03594 [Elaphomyces granulatus]
MTLRDDSRFSLEVVIPMPKRNRSPLNSSDGRDGLHPRADRKRIAKSEHQAKTRHKKRKKDDRPATQRGDVEPEAQVDVHVHDLGDGESMALQRSIKPESHSRSINSAVAKPSSSRYIKITESTLGRCSQSAHSLSEQRAEPASPLGTHASQRKKPPLGLTGFFSPEEVHAFERYKVDFCNLNGLSSSMFDELVQHSAHDKSNFPCPPSITTKKQFWQNIYATAPNRDRRSVYRFMRRHFQPSAQEPHKWTPEQDEELVELHELYGPRWAKIAKELGRSQDDVVQRWKNQVKDRDTMRRGPWSEEEVRLLQEALTLARNAGITAGYEVGKDIYELDESFIGWGVVSDYIQNTRSRKQCADKWRKIKRSVLRRRAKGNPNATYEYDPSAQAVHFENGGSKSGDSSSLRRAKPLPKSASFVTFSDDELNSDDGDTNSPATSKTTKTRSISGEVEKGPPKAGSKGDDTVISMGEDVDVEGSTGDDGATNTGAYSNLSSVNVHSSSQPSSRIITKRALAHSTSDEATEAESERSNDQESSEDKQKSVFFNSSSRDASTNDVRAKRQAMMTQGRSPLKEGTEFSSMNKKKESKLERIIRHKALSSVSHASCTSAQSTSESSSDSSSSPDEE